MGLIERYIFRNAALAFAACLVALTLVIWVTQALKELDFLTSKGQTILVFSILTGLSLPALITVIAPVALFIATIYALNKLNGDSELVIMSAAGLSPARLLRPFGLLTLIVSGLIAWTTMALMPASLRSLRDLVTRIRADFVAHIVKEGQFTTLDTGITFHYRERSGQALLGIFLQDGREPDKVIVYIAERGQTAEVNDDSYLILEKGSIQRQQSDSRDSAIIVFERYAVDLSAFNNEGSEVTYKPRERPMGDLLFPNPTDSVYLAQPGRFRAELHDRLSAPLYPVVFMLIGFAALGEARTTRQGRGAAVAAAVTAVLAIRIGGFAFSSATVRTPWALVGVYGVPLLGSLLALAVIFQGVRLKEAGAAVRQWLEERLSGLLPAPARRA